MKERPIIFSASMVRAILEGRKTQTRRMVHVKGLRNPEDMEAGGFWNCWQSHHPDGLSPRNEHHHWQYGDDWTRENYQAGQRLWVRETWCPLDDDHRSDPSKPKDWLYTGAMGHPHRNQCAYKASGSNDGDSERCRKELGYKWRSPIHMPRWASRITLEVTDVRVQRVQEISEDDAIAEGCKGLRHYPEVGGWLIPPQVEYRDLWDSIHGPGSWASNPWVWAITFRRVV